MNYNNVYDILLIAVAFLGIPVGMLLSKLAKEELRPGRKYFLLILDACLIAIFITALYFSWTKFLLIILLLTLTAFFKKKSSFFVYALLAAVMVASMKEELAYLVASFVFIFLLAFVAWKKAERKK